MPTFNSADMMDCSRGFHDFSDYSDTCHVCGCTDAEASEPIHQEGPETTNAEESPDCHAFKMAVRDAVLAALDEVCDEHTQGRVLDKDLPALFRALDPLAETLWHRVVL